LFFIGWKGILFFGVWFRSFEIVLLFLAAGTISTIAKRRGGDEWLWGGASFIGYIAVKTLVVKAGFLSGPAYEEGGFNIFQHLIAAAWVVAMAGAARFMVGRGREKAGQKWDCPSCHFFNQEDAVVCEACGLPYEDPTEKGGLPL
jgi:hypothetical protein